MLILQIAQLEGTVHASIVLFMMHAPNIMQICSKQHHGRKLVQRRYDKGAGTKMHNCLVQIYFTLLVNYTIKPNFS